MTINYDAIFQLWQARDRQGLAECLLPLMRQWVRWAFRELEVPYSYDALHDGIGDATAELVQAIDRLLLSDDLANGEHICISLKLTVKDKIKTKLKQEKRIRSKTVFVGEKGERIRAPSTEIYGPSAETRRRGLGLFERWEFWLFAYAVVDAARRRATGNTAEAVEWLLDERNLNESLSAIAGRLGVPRQTLSDALHRLGAEIAVSLATPLREFGETYFRKKWPNCAVKNPEPPIDMGEESVACSLPPPPPISKYAVIHSGMRRLRWLRPPQKLRDRAKSRRELAAS